VEESTPPDMATAIVLLGSVGIGGFYLCLNARKPRWWPGLNPEFSCFQYSSRSLRDMYTDFALALPLVGISLDGDQRERTRRGIQVTK
jgi:hypothetical protein